jgi:hypothetical protein
MHNASYSSITVRYSEACRKHRVHCLSPVLAPNLAGSCIMFDSGQCSPRNDAQICCLNLLGHEPYQQLLTGDKQAPSGNELLKTAKIS